MKNFDNEIRIISLAYYILENKTTIRATAKEFGIPKSTVHHDLSSKLKNINYSLYKQVKKLLQANFKNKHINGGESTRIKYEKLKKLINKNDEFETINIV